MVSPLRRHGWLALAGVTIVFSVAIPIVQSADYGRTTRPPARVRYQQTQTERGPVAITTTAKASSVVKVNTANFDREVLQSNKRVLVDFYADWCGPCRMLSPTLEALAREMPEAKIVKVNIDESPGLAAKYGIRSIPALIAFRSGRPVAGQVGLPSRPQLQALLAQ